MARALSAMGLLCFGLLVVSVPGGLLPFGIVLLASSLLGIDLMARQACRMREVMRPLLLLTLAVLAMSILSLVMFEQPLRDLDNRSRFLVLPWAALWTFALQPRRAWLWWGAAGGIVATLALALAQVIGGEPRAEGWANAIVLADIVLALMVIVFVCRPANGGWWVGLALAAGCLTIVLSGSRGVWLGLLLLLFVGAWSLRWRSGRFRMLALAGLVAVAGLVVVAVPALREQTRVSELQHDLQRYAHGDRNSSAGARIERLEVALRTVEEHPWAGVGIGRFDTAMRSLPVCRQQWLDRCHLGHAHNDLAEWAATQGIPGALLLIAVYGVPLWLFVRLYRRAGGREFRGPAAAGIVVVLAYALCGLTQSMFAHQVTTGFYVSIVGILAGLGLRDVRERASGSVAATGAG